MQFRTDQRRMELVMKTRLFKIWRVSLLVAAIPVLGGCVQSSATDTAKVEAQPTNTPVATPPPLNQTKQWSRFLRTRHLPHRPNLHRAANPNHCPPI